MLYRDDATHTRDSVGVFRCGYVEKNTRGCAVPVVADCPKAIGSGFAETGSVFARTRSSWSILRCACETGRLGCVIQKLFHNPQGWPSCLISKARFRPWEFEWKGLISPMDSAWGTALLEFESGEAGCCAAEFCGYAIDFKAGAHSWPPNAPTNPHSGFSGMASTTADAVNNCPHPLHFPDAIFPPL
jgi:hypothetical protein